MGSVDARRQCSLRSLVRSEELGVRNVGTCGQHYKASRGEIK